MQLSATPLPSTRQTFRELMPWNFWELRVRTEGLWDLPCSLALPLGVLCNTNSLSGSPWPWAAPRLPLHRRGS